MLIFPFSVKTTLSVPALLMGTEGVEQQRASDSSARMKLLQSLSLEPPTQIPPLSKVVPAPWSCISTAVAKQV